MFCLDLDSGRLYNQFVSTNSTSFKLGRRGVIVMLWFVAVGGLVLSIGFAVDRSWMAVVMFASSIFTVMVARWLPGVLRLDESGLEIQRRNGTQRLRWADVDRAIWDRPQGLAGLAIDNWVLTLRGRTESGKQTTVVLSGPMLERHQEARQLLAARFPPPS